MKSQSLFPENMRIMPESLTLDTIAGKLTYFQEQLQLLHWQTTSYAEHQALGGLYDFVHDFKDGLIEKIMGYTQKRPGVFKIPALSNSTSQSCINDLLLFATQLKQYGDMNGFHDVGNLADTLSGEAAKVRYLLTLS